MGFFVKYVQMYFSIIKNDYTKWSLVVLIGSLLASFLNYAFTLIMGRMLGPSFFGEVSTIFGLMVILVAPTQAISNYVARHISVLAGQGDYLTVKVWLRKISRLIFFFSLALIFLFWLSVPILSRFLRIDPLPLFVFSFFIPFAFILAAQTGALQGLKSFRVFSFQSILGAALKLSLAVILVYIGLFVPGVMLALVISLGLASFYNYIKIKSVWKKLNKPDPALPKISGIDIKSIFSKSFLIVFSAALLIALISNIDVVLAKHFFEPRLAGQYAALSVIGKILLYVTSAFVTVMFAIVSESFAEKKGYAKKTFRNSLLSIIVVSLPAIVIFSLAPKAFVGAFFGSAYIMIAPLLPVFSVAMFLLALSIAFVHYFLAARNNSFLLPFAVGVFLQIILISLNHDSALNIAMSVLWSSIFLLAALATNYLFIERREIFSRQYALPE